MGNVCQCLTACDPSDIEFIQESSTQDNSGRLQKIPKNDSKKSAFKRGEKHHQTVGGVQFHEDKDYKKKFMESYENFGNVNLATSTGRTSASKFYRRGNKRTISLVEKSKMGSNIHKEELRLSVMNSLFINEVRGVPKKYQIIKEIGSGAYGTVYLTEHMITKGKFAMKKIEKSSEDLLVDNEIKDEIEILKGLDHPNILKILEFYNTPQSYYIITDYCQNGELFYQREKRFSETQLAVIFRQIFSGLAYLHENHIVHRDLKLENILITDIEKSIKTNEELYSIKIIDFGTAKLFDKNHKQRCVVGSSYYIAPEVLSHEYNEKCDMWSAGVILYMLVTGLAPFNGPDDAEILEKIKEGVFDKSNERYQNASPEVKDLIDRLLEFNPNQRLSALEALHHDWFSVKDSYLLFSNIPEESIQEFIHNLLNYSIKSKFQEMVLAYIIHNMPRPQEAKDIIKLFQWFNVSGDGKLIKEELRSSLENFLDDSYLKNLDDIFIMLDGGNNGYISYEEFMRGCIDKKKLLTDETLAYAFNFFDNDNKGTISVDKIKPYFVDSQNVSEEVFKNIFSEIDENKDGFIDFSEFKEMMLDFD